jgi:hypothetical protein
MRRLTGWFLAFLPLALLAAGAGWVLVSSHQRGISAPVGSSLRSDAEGTRALFLLLEETGHRISRLTRPVPPEGAILLCVEPAPSPPGLDARLLDWLQEGGTLVLAASARSLEVKVPFT